MAKLIGCLVIGLVVYCVCHFVGIDSYYVTMGSTNITASFVVSIVVGIYFAS